MSLLKESFTPAQSNAKVPRICFPEDITKLGSNPVLPDPFRFFDPQLGTGGRVVTKADWLARREEIKDLAQYYYFGYKQPTPQAASKLGTHAVEVPETLTIDKKKATSGMFSVNLPEGSYRWNFDDFSLRPILDYRSDAWGSWDGHQELLITIPAHTRIDSVVTVTVDGRTADIKLDAVTVPVQGVDTALCGPYPAMIVIGGLSAEQITTLKQNGYAYISMNTGSVFSDNASFTGAYTALCPKAAGVYENDSGSLMGWAWGVSRIIDALLNDASFNIDGTRTAVTGCSRNGKAALLAAAFDERISVAVPCDPGATGLSGFRHMNEGQLFNYNTYNIHCEVNRVFSRNEKPQNTIGGSGFWLSSKAQEFIPYHAARIPFDMHEVAALIAPRPLLAFSGENFDWLNSISTALTIAAVREVYEFMGAADELALVVRDAGHANQDRDLPYIIAVMDKAFGRSDVLTVKQFASLKNPGDIGALDGNGVIKPAGTYPTIAAMETVPYELDSCYQPWSRPGKYFIWTDSELLTEGFAREITVHSDAPQVCLTLPDGTRLTQDIKDGAAIFALTAAQVKAGRYVLETAGAEYTKKTVYFQGFDLTNALRHGLNLTSTSPDGMNVGFTSKLAERQSIEVYLTSGGETKRLDTGFIDGYSPVYLEAYGVSLKQKSIPEGPFTLTLKKLALEALPGCVFELSLDLTGVQTPNMYAGGALEGRASSVQGEKPTWNSSFLKYGPIPEWPIYPASVQDTGERPAAIPTVTAFKTAITASKYSSGKVTLSFSTPVNPREFGIGFNKIISWTTAWAEDAKSVTITCDKPAQEDMKLYLFRLTDADNNMIPGPAVFTL